jgi:pyrroline-5-carboxylate reductase
VTSAGGTTAAALEVLADGRVEAVFAQALAAAAARSRALNP